MNIEFDTYFTAHRAPTVQNITYIQERLTELLRSMSVVNARRKAGEVMKLTGTAWKVDKAAEIEMYENSYGTMVTNHRMNGESLVTGTFPKRIKRILKRVYDVTLTDEQIANMGEAARRGIVSEEGVTLYMGYKGTIDWRAGDFGDNGSCFWEDLRDAKDMIVGAGGGAVCHWHDEDHDDGASRCWIIPYDQGAVIFNAYGELNLAQFAGIVGENMGMTWDEVGLENNGSTCDKLYINSGGYYLRPTDAPNYRRIDFNIPEPPEMRTCWHCYEQFPKDDMHYIHCGNWVCDDCRSEHYVQCPHCHDWMKADYVYETCCIYCGKLCADCHTYYLSSFMRDATPHEMYYTWVCQDCYIRRMEEEHA